MINYILSAKEDNDFGVLLPVTVRRNIDGSVTVSAYADVFNAVKAIPADDVFGDEYRSAVEKICADAGYDIESDIENSDCYVYRRQGGGTYGGSAVPLTEESLKYENMLSEWDMRETLELCDKAYIRVVDGRIVSIAAGNYIKEFGDAEISAETAEGYRGSGYASDCINALCGALDGRIAYICGIDNLPSVRTAERCGFERVGRVRYFVAFENED